MFADVLHSLQAANAILSCPGIAQVISSKKRCRRHRQPLRASRSIVGELQHEGNSSKNHESTNALPSFSRAGTAEAAAAVTEINDAAAAQKKHSHYSAVSKLYGHHERVSDAAPLNHLAVIMDGNSRWARRRGLPTFSGHQAGLEATRKTVRWCLKRGIHCLTVYALSTENWQRDDAEVKFLLQLIDGAVDQELSELVRTGVQLHFIGDKALLPPSLAKKMARAEAATKSTAPPQLILTVAISYGGRQDIVAAVKSICERVANGEITPDKVDDNLLAAQLALEFLPAAFRNPELIIRSSGEKRLSNFLLYESAYAELYFSEVMWPDFGDDELDAALEDFSKRERRFGRH